MIAHGLAGVGVHDAEEKVVPERGTERGPCSNRKLHNVNGEEAAGLALTVVDTLFVDSGWLGSSAKMS